MLSKKINKYVIVLTVMISLPLVAQNEPLTQHNGVAERFIQGDSTIVAKHSPVSTSIPGVAIDGYDPVAYFTQNKAVKGDEALVCDYNGTTWRFSNKEHRDLFLSDPEKYAPQFGGFCAQSITHNQIVISNPEAFVVKDDKLYLYVDEAPQIKDVGRKPIQFKLLTEKREQNWFKFESRF